MNLKKVLLRWWVIIWIILIGLLVWWLYLISYLWWRINNPTNQQQLNNLAWIETLIQKANILEQQAEQLNIQWLTQLVDQSKLLLQWSWNMMSWWNIANQELSNSVSLLQSKIDLLWSWIVTSWQIEEIKSLVAQINAIIGR
jgi:hypothetical protein